MSKPKLLPCPFCGDKGNPGILKGKGDYSINRIYCGRCGVTNAVYDTPEIAIKAWNTRKPMEDLERGYKSAKTILENLVKNNIDAWIPVSEQLPEKMGVYLIYARIGGIGIQYFGTDGFVKGITHWMPLPDPPEGKE